MPTEISNFFESLSDYLNEEKYFVANPSRCYEIKNTIEQAKRLFPEAKITIEDDPLQTGSLFVRIIDYDYVVREIKVFQNMVKNADNFEIYQDEDNEKIVCNICFNNALKRV